MEKALKVIASCETIDQWKSARNYVELYYRNVGADMRLSAALDKKLDELYRI